MAGHFLAVDIHIAHIHHALKIEHNALPLQFGRHREGLSVPAFTHRLEASSGVFLFVPRLLKLIVVGQVEVPPPRVVEIDALGALRIAQLKFPVEIEQDVLLLLKCGKWCVLRYIPRLLLDVLRLGRHPSDG